MNDKEKQIKEIANSIEKVKLYGNDNYERKISYNSRLTLVKEIYDKLFPEDSVVLSKEEYEMILETQKHLEKKYSDMRDELNLRKNENEIIKQNYIQLKQDNEQTRKETAKELLTAQFKEYKECEKLALKARNNNKNDDYYKGFSLATTNQKMYLKELAKQFGVEIKELKSDGI